MKALFGSHLGLVMLLALAGCCSSLGTGGGKPSTTYIVVPAGQPLPGQPGAVAPSH